MPRTTPHRTARRLVTVALATAALLTTGISPAVAANGSGPTAVVAMGDSYISGEAGRWQGNSLTTSGNRNGTDRAWTGSGYDPSRVYGTTAANGCHRSDSAEVKSAGPIASTLVNLACSGATTRNVFRASQGGVAYKGEAPQADQLAAVAASHDVGTIVLSIGGNDLGFADIIRSCATDYIVWYSYCHDDQQAAVDAKIDTVMADVGRSVDEIRAVMAGAGYAASDYRIVLQSYPSPIPRGAENRYPESGWSRTNTGGCPFWNRDSDWARDTLVPQVSNRLKGVAASKGVQFMDLRDMLQGREVCARTAKLVSATVPASAASSEWARWIDPNETQGPIQENVHPNYYGQLALGRCLALIHARPTGNFSCRNTAGSGASGMYLTAVS